MQKASRVISLLPSATEIIFELGLDELLKGVTHECTYPKDALKKTRVIEPMMDFSSLNSEEIDNKIKKLAFNNLPVFKLDSGEIKKINPDLIISQSSCSVCAPFNTELQKMVSILGYSPKNLVINPDSVNDILESILIIGKEFDKFEVAKQIVNALEIRLSKIKEEVKIINRKGNLQHNRIICLDWINPFYVAGHWVPEMVEIAGATNLIGTTGSNSKQILLEDILNEDPDKIILMPCGYDIEKSLTEYHSILGNNRKWNSLRSVRQKNVYIVNSNFYFSKPSPRIITGIEILACLMYPDLNTKIKVPTDGFICV